MELRVVEREDWSPGIDLWHSYTLEVRPRGGTEYRKVTRVSMEDRPSMREESINVVNAELAHAIVGSVILAVTTDGGRNWRTWDIDDFDGGKDCDRGWIDSVALNPDGTGLLTVDCLDLGPKPQLITTDFGRHWQPAK